MLFTRARPEDATHVIAFQYYKIGRNGFVYRHNGEEWIKSNMESHKLNKSTRV